MNVDKNLTSGFVELENFCKEYEKNVRACSGVDFYAKQGEVTGLLGPNGAGKSTLLKAVCGVHYATSGQVKVYGLTDAVEIRRITGFVPEYPELDPSLTVKEELYFNAELFGIKKDKQKALVEKAVDTCSLKDVFTVKISALSKGFRQRVSLAKALVIEPKVLVLDEFSGGLDPEQIVKIKKEILKLSKTSTVILSTHNIQETENLCSKIYIICEGKVSVSGSIKEILQKTGASSLEKAYLSLTSKSKKEKNIKSGEVI